MKICCFNLELVILFCEVKMKLLAQEKPCVATKIPRKNLVSLG